MSDISSTLKSKLLSQYGTYTSTNYNAKATAYLLDTNVWSGFANSSYADYAIGGPSLELFVDSYNTTHAEENTLETQVVDDGNGYHAQHDHCGVLPICIPDSRQKAKPRTLQLLFLHKYYLLHISFLMYPFLLSNNRLNLLSILHYSI